MKRLFKRIFCFALAFSGLFSFCSFSDAAEIPIDGGLDDFSNPQAPKVIQSNTITEFSLQFKEDMDIDRAGTVTSFPAGEYLLKAERKGDKARFYLIYDSQDTSKPLIFKQDLPVEALDELQAIIKKKNLAAINGSSLRNSALGTLLIFHVHYDSGERLSVYAEGGAATLPDGWCGTEVFLEFFMEKLQAEKILLGKEGR